MNNCLILLFGATGDLSRRKLLPAFYQLLKDGRIDNFAIVGAAIEDVTPDLIFAGAAPYCKEIDQSLWKRLQERFTYCKVDAHNKADFEKLQAIVTAIRTRYQLPEKTVIYCSVAEQFYAPIIAQLHEVGLVYRTRSSDDRWCRAVFEKPFGSNYEAVHQLNRHLLRYINEEQIYRIDHYLAKEIVETISFLRFTNRIFEPLWNHYHIESVMITLDESIDLEGRGGYYDRYGVVKDMIQSHGLQLLALTAMDAPQQLTANGIQDAKSHILKATVCTGGLLGQYDGYHDEVGVSADSQQSTFALLSFAIEDYRWTGVPFYIRTGKALAKKESKIVVNFKDTHCLLPKNCPTQSNYLTISIFPEGGFSLAINAKKPYVRDEVTSVNLAFCYDCLFVPQAPSAYEVVIEQVLRGDRSIAVRVDEIEYSWNIVDNALSSLGLPLYAYQKGSYGPQEVSEFCRANNITWR